MAASFVPLIEAYVVPLYLLVPLVFVILFCCLYPLLYKMFASASKLLPLLGSPLPPDRLQD